MKYWKKALCIVLMAGMIMSMLSGCGAEKNAKDFLPQLDVNESVELNVIGFFGNFEAFDQITADFNKYYPNVHFAYRQVSGRNLKEFMEVSEDIDIFMTSDEFIQQCGSGILDYCADLEQVGVDVSDIEKDMIEGSCYEGTLISIPMAQNMYGIVVNTSLLEKEGLSVPENYSEFVSACQTLKEKGYVPVQAPNSKAIAELLINMFFVKVINDNTLYQNMKAGEVEQVSDALKPIFDIADTFVKNGYIDENVNAEYPEDNYDGAILRFFEGNVPFWVCNTENVSGMKKRESKSEAFSADPFKYQFIYAPVGEKGSYQYEEPWYGFALAKKSLNQEYAKEFIRFMTIGEEMNKLADVKGVPSVAKNKNDSSIYKDVLNPKHVQEKAVKNRSITFQLMTGWYSSMNKYLSGEYSSVEQAVEQLINKGL